MWTEIKIGYMVKLPMRHSSIRSSKNNLNSKFLLQGKLLQQVSKVYKKINLHVITSRLSWYFKLAYVVSQVTLVNIISYLSWYFKKAKLILQVSKLIEQFCYVDIIS